MRLLWPIKKQALFWQPLASSQEGDAHPPRRLHRLLLRPLLAKGLEMNLSYPAPSSVWEANHSLKPTLYWVRCLAPMGKPKPVSFLCGGAHLVAEGPWISLKYFRGDRAKVAPMRWLWTWACSACWDLCASNGKFIISRKPACNIQRRRHFWNSSEIHQGGLQEENTSGVSRQKCPTIFFSL